MSQSQTQRSSRVDLLHGSILKSLLLFALPIMASRVFQQIYNTMDTLIVGHTLGDSSIAAMGACSSIYEMMTGFTFGVGNGLAIVTARCFGRQETERMKKSVASCIVIGITVTLVVTVLATIFMHPLLRLLKTPAEILEESYSYISILSVFLFVMFAYNLCSGLLGAIGNSFMPLVFLIISSLVNIVLDLLFIRSFGMGVRGAAIATVISQTLSAAFVLYFLKKRSELNVRFLTRSELSRCTETAKNIVSLGTAGFIMQLTNSLVSICCNNVLSVTGGDIYISVMTIISSVRQLVETPIYAMNEGSSPILSYNYGARRPKRVKQAIGTMAAMIFAYTAIMWSVIIVAPHFLIGIFSSDSELIKDAVPALKLYFAAFIFMDLQYIGQTTFKSLNKKKQAIFFSLLRKVFIVVPLTYLLPYALGMGTRGVFMAEPVSNVIGGSLCFLTMLATVIPELNHMEKQK